MTTGLQALAGGRACCGGRRDCVAVVSGDVLLVAVFVFLAVQTLANRQSAVFISKACS